MQQKLDMRHHKTLLSVTLLTMLIIGVFFGALLASVQELPVLEIVTFALVLLLFALSLVSVSVLIRTRDELHEMHEENQQRFHVVHEGIKATSTVVSRKK